MNQISEMTIQTVTLHFPEIKSSVKIKGHYQILEKLHLYFLHIFILRLRSKYSIPMFNFLSFFHI